ncbi:MAG: hypothetical protein WC812_01010 [Candidatus Pacearchaeota archaeon]|jgi:hypothetical protein
MKKLFGILGIFVLVFAAGAFAIESNPNSFNTNSIVKQVAEDRGLDAEKVQEVKQVDFENLPEEINIENIDTTNLAMYEVAYEGEEKPFYVITVSNEVFDKVQQSVAGKLLINFGYAEEIKESQFLETSTGVQTSYEKGYVMMRKGSITGMSTNLEVLNSGSTGQVELIIYKNGEEIGFRNSIVSENSGIKNDYDVQSANILNFEPGDVISVYAKINGEVLIKDVTTMIEVEYF